MTNPYVAPDLRRAFIQGFWASRKRPRNPYPRTSVLGEAWQGGLDARRAVLRVA